MHQYSNYLSIIKDLKDTISALSDKIDRLADKQADLEELIRNIISPGSSPEIKIATPNCLPQSSFFSFADSIIREMKDRMKIRTSETYIATMRSFRRFRNNADIPISDIDSSIIQNYEKHLRETGICDNSVSFYLRILRAIYNRAVDSGLVSQTFPFKHAYTGVDKTQKRAISLADISRIKNLNLKKGSPLDFARDMFMFSFYTRGMSFVDMAYLKKNDLHCGFLYYRRKKTGQWLAIRWEKDMQRIANKYYDVLSYHLLPIIRHKDSDERRQYIYAEHNVNRNLRIIGEMLALPIPLTMYVARHSWASIAKSQSIPLSVISEALGHNSESTTQIYLSSLDSSALDLANRKIILALR